jgi:CRP/FNR family transcriptional regulator, cyclic AMP receptor protein
MAPLTILPFLLTSFGVDLMSTRFERRCCFSADDTLAALQHHPLFGDLPRDDLERLSTYVSTRGFARGSTIFSKGDPGTSLFAICFGTVRISLPSPDRRDAIFRGLVGAGEIFGEIALLDGRPRTADATAMTDCAIMVIDRREFLPLILSQTDIALKLMEVLCARLRTNSEQVEDMLFLDLEGRLAKLLLRLTTKLDSGGPHQRIELTQHEIARMIGMSRESTNRQLQAWKELNWIRLERKGIVVLELDALCAVGTPASGRRPASSQIGCAAPKIVPT